MCVFAHMCAHVCTSVIERGGGGGQCKVGCDGLRECACAAAVEMAVPVLVPVLLL